MSDASASSGREIGVSGDDQVLPFRTLRSRTQGRIARLGAVADSILSGHAYPDRVSEALGEALALAAMLGSLLRPSGRLILQTRTDGPVHTLAVHLVRPGRMRGLASFDVERLARLEAEGRVGPGHLLGSGHLALTIDHGGAQPRTQGIVALANHSLSQAAYTYFRQSEQIPTFVRVAVARHSVRGAGGGAAGWRWRAGGLLLQQLPEDVGTGGAMTAADEEAGRIAGEVAEDWQRARMLAATVEDHELLDPMLPPDRLLWRLFAEEGVTVSPAQALEAHCGCSRERVEALLKGFGADELADMREADGAVLVKCEYCNANYRFDAEEISRL